MAGLLAWAADVVRSGGGATSEDDESSDSIPLIFNPDQEKYIRELNLKSTALKRSVQDLRNRIPPPDISQRLPDLHAHSIASNAALTLQLNAHSSTKQQAQMREVTLYEENVAFEKAISECEGKIQEKVREGELLRVKLEELDTTLTSEVQDERVVPSDGDLGDEAELLLESKDEGEAYNAARIQRHQRRR